MTGGRSGRRLQRIFLGIGGIVVIVLGVFLLFLPGPGILLILVGLWILGREYGWAGRLSGALRNKRREKPRTSGGGSHFEEESTR